MELDWTAIRYLLEIERSGTFRAAASKLRVHHATVSRHVADVQEGLGVRLLQRDGRKLVFTPAGRELLGSARLIEEQITELGRSLSGRDLRPSGRVRVAMPESIVAAIAPRLKDLATAYPEISIELLTGLSFKNLSRMEADIAVRVVSSAPTSSLVGRRVGKVMIRAYGTAALLDTIEPCSVEDYPWIGWTDEFDHFAMETWLRGYELREGVRSSIDSVATLIAMVVGGAGVGFLPSFLAARLPGLRPASHEDVPVFESEAWVLMHEDLRAVPRVLAVSRWLCEQCDSLMQL